MRGPLTDLLLVVYRRKPARDEDIEILGDKQLLDLGDKRLLDFWLERVGFG